MYTNDYTKSQLARIVRNAATVQFSQWLMKGWRKKYSSHTVCERANKYD